MLLLHMFPHAFWWICTTMYGATTEQCNFWFAIHSPCYHTWIFRFFFSFFLVLQACVRLASAHFRVSLLFPTLVEVDWNSLRCCHCDSLPHAVAAHWARARERSHISPPFSQIDGAESIRSPLSWPRYLLALCMTAISISSFDNRQRVYWCAHDGSVLMRRGHSSGDRLC